MLSPPSNVEKIEKVQKIKKGRLRKQRQNNKAGPYIENVRTIQKEMKRIGRKQGQIESQKRKKEKGCQQPEQSKNK